MKSQAETAGRLSSQSARPKKGTVLRDVELGLRNGPHALLSTIRGRSNLIMFFGVRSEELLRDLAVKAPAIKEQNARVLVIRHEQVTDPHPAASDLFVVAVDPSGHVQRALAATDPAGNPVPTIYVTDRFGEVFAVFQSTGAQSLPCADEIIRWLEFINFQCEECSPPEWPE